MNPQFIPEDAVQRIRYMEQIFDELLAADPASLNAEKLACLTEYYENGQWLADYELDEAGLLPAGLKRGVLSQDGVHTLLENITHG